MPALSGDLDAVVAKAMQFEAGARHAGAAQLADDLRRYLAQQPVSAHPDTAAYRARLWVRRHPWAIATLLCLPYLAEWFEYRPRLDPVRWTTARIIEDAAYGCGVWRGCIQSRSVEPLLPSIAWRGVRRSDHHPPPHPRP